MKREIRTVDKDRGIIQITTPDERFYGRQVSADGTEVNKRWEFVPSVSWIADFFPKSVGFYKWLATKGWSEAEAIKTLAGDKGSKVHQAIAMLVAGGTVSFEDSFMNARSLELEPLTPDEYLCLMSFKEWFDEVNPEVLESEKTVWNEHYFYAGTMDLKLRIGRTVWIVDIKTSADIWPAHELQVSAYKHADPAAPKGVKLAILQVGYRRNKIKKWKFTPIADQFDLFLAARKIWRKETSGVQVLQRDFPLSLSLNQVPTELKNGAGSMCGKEGSGPVVENRSVQSGEGENG